MPDRRSRANRVPGFNLDGSPDRRFRANRIDREGTPEPAIGAAAEPDADWQHTTTAQDPEPEPDAAATTTNAAAADQQRPPRRAASVRAEAGIRTRLTPRERESGAGSIALARVAEEETRIADIEAAEDSLQARLLAGHDSEGEDVDVERVEVGGTIYYWAETGDTWYHEIDEAPYTAPTPRPQMSLRDTEAFARGVRVFPVRVTQPVFAFCEQELTQGIIDKGNQKCAVCLVAQQCGDRAIVLTCRHAFHKDCVRPWLAEHRTCPVCRADAETGEPQTTTTDTTELDQPEQDETSEPEPDDDLYQFGLALLRVAAARGQLEPTTTTAAEQAATTDQPGPEHPEPTEPSTQPDPEREPEPTTAAAAAEPEPDYCEQCGTDADVCDYWWVEQRNETWKLCEQCGVDEGQEKCEDTETAATTAAEQAATTDQPGPEQPSAATTTTTTAAEQATTTAAEQAPATDQPGPEPTDPEPDARLSGPCHCGGDDDCPCQTDLAETCQNCGLVVAVRISADNMWSIADCDSCNRNLCRDCLTSPREARCLLCQNEHEYSDSDEPAAQPDPEREPDPTTEPEGPCCCKCDSTVPEEYLTPNPPDEMWVECSCGAHYGWYCPRHSPTNECWEDEDCNCCNPPTTTTTERLL